MSSALILLARLLFPALLAAPSVGSTAWLSRCLAPLRQSALEQGAPLPTDSPSGADYGSCAARCAGRCFLRGDFDGDGKTRELAVANPEELLLFHDLERGRDKRLRSTLKQRLPLSGPLAGGEVALVSAPRALRFADEVVQLRGGKSLLPTLAKGEHAALGLIIWRETPGAKGESSDDDEDSDDPPSENGQLVLAIFDSAAGSYHLQPLLELGAP